MKESLTLVKEEENAKPAKKAHPILEKISNIFFGLFVTVLFTLPVWCILMIVIYFVNRL